MKAAKSTCFCLNQEVERKINRKFQHQQLKGSIIISEKYINVTGRNAMLETYIKCLKMTKLFKYTYILLVMCFAKCIIDQTNKGEYIKNTLKKVLFQTTQ